MEPAIPNYVDEMIVLPTGEQRHMEGWELVFAPSIILEESDVLVWREKCWRINTVRVMLTNSRYMLTEIPENPVMVMQARARFPRSIPQNSPPAIPQDSVLLPSEYLRAFMSMTYDELLEYFAWANDQRS